MGKGRGRGGAQLGKAVKGKSKDRKKDKSKLRNAITEQRLDEEIKILQEYEKINKLWEAQRNRLKKLAQQTSNDSKLNAQLIKNAHRQMMRDEKIDSLRKEIQIAAQNHERDIDRRDANIQSLTRDLDDSEEQYQTAQRAHLDKMQTLISIHDAKISRLELEFDRDVKALTSEFIDERKHIERLHIDETKEAEAVDKAIALENLRNTEDAKARHSAQVQTIRNKHDGLLSELKRTLENKIADLEKNFDQLHKSYKDTTDGANQNFKKLELEDARRAEFIKLQEQLIAKYQENLAHWSKVLSSNYNECTARNGALRTQRDLIMKHCNDLKARMKKFRQVETKRLTELTSQSRAALQQNEAKLIEAQKILQLAELGRKWETEREKVVPFYQSTPIPPQLLPPPTPAKPAKPAPAQQRDEKEAGGSGSDDKEEEAVGSGGDATGRDSLADVAEVFGLGQGGNSAPDGASLKASALQLDGSAVGHWSYLENFHKKYNKVLLDKLAIAAEKKRLAKENSDLRGILKQYLDGISITEDVVDQDNPLLIVNGKVNLVEKMPVRRGAPRTIQEGHHIVHNQITHARRSNK